MVSNPFAAVLQEQLREAGAAQESLEVLQQFCSGVEESTGGRVECALERGYAVTYGQEWRPVLRSAQGGVAPVVLFRAYVPPQAWPVTLDLHESSLVECADREQLTRALEEFLRDPNVVAQIRYVMGLAPLAAAGA